MDIEVNINNVEYIYLNHNYLVKQLQYLVSKNDKLLKLRQSRKQIIVSSILPKNKRNSLSSNTGQMFWSPLKVTQKFHTQNLIQALLL